MKHSHVINTSGKSRSADFWLCLLLPLATFACDASGGGRQERDYSGVYCLNIENMEMTIVQTGSVVTFTATHAVLTDGTGTVDGKTMLLTANISDTDTFTATITFANGGKSFSGPYQVTDADDQVTMEGTLVGNKGECPSYDIEANGIPQFVGHDFTQVSRIEMISRFRSGVGHSYTDGTETCRSMKHYYAPYDAYRENDTVEIYSPVRGTITTVVNDGHGASIGLKNKQIHIRPDDQPAFNFVIFHCDVLSSAIATGKKVAAGELLGYARLYYDDLDEYADNFDIAVSVNTPSGNRLVPYFETMDDVTFDGYVSRGAVSRDEFTITREARDADPLECDGETFMTSGTLENWVTLD